jgi:hypothetical protein
MRLPWVSTRIALFNPLSFLRLAQLGDHGEVFQRGDVSGDFAVRGQFLEYAAHDLAAAGLGQELSKADVVGAGQRADLLRKSYEPTLGKEGSKKPLTAAQGRELASAG